jgi:thioredoxin 1
MTPNPSSSAAATLLHRRVLNFLAACVLLGSIVAPLAAAPAAPIHISHKEFKSAVLRSELPVVVDFWATWCGPCRKIAPALESLAAEYSGQLVVAKVNVDENLMFTHRYGVEGLPTLLVFKGGREVGRLQGNRKPEVLRAELEAMLDLPAAGDEIVAAGR